MTPRRHFLKSLCGAVAAAAVVLGARLEVRSHQERWDQIVQEEWNNHLLDNVAAMRGALERAQIEVWQEFYNRP